MKILVLFALVGIASCFSLSFDPELDRQWEDFKKTFGKTYSGKEETLRRLAWEENVATIVKHNIRADLGFHTYHMGLNKYSDLTPEEFKRTMNGYRVGNNSQSDGSTWVPPSNVRIPDQVDWREEGYVTPVKDQGSCGSCWAFSTTGSLEGQHKRKTGQLTSLSEQNLVDCAKGNSGCAGGWMDTAFQYIRDNKGIDTETSYPYTAKDGTCRFKAEGVGATCTGFVDISVGDEEALKEAVATVGPISVAIDSTREGFISYKDGVYVDPECATDVFTHAILVVGYGTQDGADYWLVKNSWGETWGQKGYIMMARNKNNQCGIASKASYPLV